MSNIITTSIDESFPVQGQDNNSQGFRNNFSAIKNALTVAKSEITSLENTSVKNNVGTNFNGNKLENIVFNNVSDLYKNKGIPEDQQISLDVKDAKAFKIKCIGNTTVRFTSWPQNQPSVAKLHKILLHIQFELDPADVNLLNYRINFSTDLGGEIRSYRQNTDEYAAWRYEVIAGGWYLKPWKYDAVSTNYNDYEHVFEAWSYNNGLAVFIKYLGSFA